MAQPLLRQKATTGALAVPAKFNPAWKSPLLVAPSPKNTSVATFAWRSRAAHATPTACGICVPTKGLTLPLMSYGRSSLITSLAWLGVVLRVHYETARGVRRAPREVRA